MFAILVYDISLSEQKERKNYRKIVKIVENYLQRVQNSVFEGEIQPHHLLELKNRLKKEIHQELDSIVIYTFKNSGYTEKIELGIQIEHLMFS